jgi:hypothetical protein
MQRSNCSQTECKEQELLKNSLHSFGILIKSQIIQE